eukprot:3068559-Prymnesium_polylepis.1
MTAVLANQREEGGHHGVVDRIEQLVVVGEDLRQHLRDADVVCQLLLQARDKPRGVQPVGIVLAQQMPTEAHAQPARAMERLVSARQVVQSEELRRSCTPYPRS